MLGIASRVDFNSASHALAPPSSHFGTPITFSVN